MVPCSFAKTSMDFKCFPRGLTLIYHYTSTTNFSITCFTMVYQVYRSREDRSINSILQNKSDPESRAFESTNATSV
jgi:hypothetical protein